jgi:hypothetical protein
MIYVFAWLFFYLDLASHAANKVKIAAKMYPAKSDRGLEKT